MWIFSRNKVLNEKSNTLIELAKRVAASDVGVFINGPTGSGKELVARKIHKNSSRSREPFIIINAALLKEKTYEKEFLEYSGIHWNTLTVFL